MSSPNLTSNQLFAAFRICLGTYLTVHFASLIPYGAEVFGAGGMVSRAQLSPTFGLFPNILFTFDSPIFVKCFLGFLTAGSIAFACGFKRPYWSLILWYGWACLFNRNILISNPGLPYVGWLLLACVLVPRGEVWSIDRPKKNWYMPRLLTVGAWALLALGYTVSGLHKMGATAWMDGTALLHLLDNPLARDYWLTSWLQSLPLPIIHILTWSVLALEIGYVALIINKKTRLIVWLGMVAMHLGIMLTVDFVDLTLGMLLVHLLVFDPDWVHSGQANARDNPGSTFV